MSVYAGSRLITRLASAERYALRDEFTTALAAGSVNGTVADGANHATRVVTDTGSSLSIAGGAATFAAAVAAQGDPGLWSSRSYTRRAGRVFVAGITPGNTSVRIHAGWDTNQAGGLTEGVAFAGTGLLRILDNGSAVTVGTYTATAYQVATVMRGTAGSWIFIKGGAFTYWTLLWVSATSTASPLYPAVINDNAAQAFTCEYIHLPELGYIPAPLGSDSFNRADGSLGTTDGAGHAEQNGGAGKTWTSQAGTWAVSSNAAAASALSGGLAGATYDCGHTDIIHDVAATVAAGVAGGIVRFTDGQNHIRAYHDGTNCKLDKVVGGVVSTVISGTATYSAGAVIRVRCNGTTFRLFYNDAAVGGAGTINDAALQTGTAVGLVTTNTGNTLNNVVTWVQGGENEHARLDRWV